MTRRQVVNIYKLDLVDQAEIRQAMGVWKNNARNFKSKIKNHLKREQEYSCCYCKKRIVEDISLEHVIAQTRNNGFVFDPVNLFICCPRCQGKKLSKPVLINQDDHAWRTYPTVQEFSIPHPHYDDYLTHIQIVQNVIYEPRSLEGENLIQMLSLDSPQFIIDRCISKLKENQIDELKQLHDMNEQDRNDFVHFLEEYLNLS